MRVYLYAILIKVCLSHFLKERDHLITSDREELQMKYENIMKGPYNHFRLKQDPSPPPPPSSNETEPVTSTPITAPPIIDLTTAPPLLGNETLITEIGVVPQKKVSDGDLFDDKDYNISDTDVEQIQMLSIMNQTLEDPFYTLKELRERQNMKYMTTDDSNIRCIPLCTNRGICQMG
jgi:hypothetical protein